VKFGQKKCKKEGFLPNFHRIMQKMQKMPKMQKLVKNAKISKKYNNARKNAIAFF